MSKFEKFLNGDGESDARSDFEKILEPDTDFLPGALLASNSKALKAAQEEVSRRVREADKGVRIEWDGTVGTAIKDGKVVDKIEIHGATYSDSTGEVAGVRFDATGVKLAKESQS